MPYGANKRADGLDTLTTLASDDLIIVSDLSDTYRAKTITKANFATDLSAVNASETVKGVVEEATDAEVLAGTATGATGAKLFVTPAKLVTNLPSMTGGNLIVSMTAEENLTAGNPVGVSNNMANKVALAYYTSKTVTTSFTAAVGFVGNVNPYCSIATDKFVFADTQTSNDTLYVTVGSVALATKTLTLGTSVAVTADISGTIYAVSKLDTDKFIVFYAEDASATIINYRIGTVSGTTITLGDAALFTTGATAVNYLGSEFLSTDKGVMVYKTSTVTDARVIAFTTSGTIATPGTPSALNANVDGNADTAVVKIDTDKFIIVSVTEGYAQAGTCVGGTTITLGSAAQYATTYANTIEFFAVASPTTDTIIIRFRNGAGNTNTDMVAGTVSGTTITFGSVLTSVLSSDGGGIYADSTSSVLVNDRSALSIVKVTLSGTTLTSQGIIVQSVTGLTGGKLFNLGTYYIELYLPSATLTYHIQGMSNGFIGIAQSTVSRSASVNVLVRGKDTNQTNLIPGAYYLVNNGALTFVKSNVTVNTIDDVNYVKALSTTDIIL